MIPNQATHFKVVKNSRDIINRKQLTLNFRDIVACENKKNWRKLLLKQLKEAYQHGFNVIKRRHLIDGVNGWNTALASSFLCDQTLRIIYDFTVSHIYPVSNPTDYEHISLIAIGGYGRREMAPFSDIDLLFLVPAKGTAWCEKVSEYILYFLWDMGFKVGHSVRTENECIKYAKEDITIRTALLENRYIWGDKKLFSLFHKNFLKKVVANSGVEFVKKKLAERDTRHIRMGDTRYLVEPNVKNGKGGLRDLQTLWWIAKYLYSVQNGRDLISSGFLTDKEYKQFRKAEDFLWTVRCTLHYIAGRAEERLTFQYQKELAEKLHYKNRSGLSSVERFMKHYFIAAKVVGDLTRIFCEVLENKHSAKDTGQTHNETSIIEGFRLEGKRLNFISPQDLKKDLTLSIKIFHSAHKHGFDIHPEALRIINEHLPEINNLRHNKEALSLFLDIMMSQKSPEVSLKRLNESGVMGRLIPDFGRIISQMQFDMYHHFTVDEHTITAIGLLAAIERGDLDNDHPVASVVVHKIISRKILYMAVFLHDIAKGRKGDHSIIGAEVAKKLCPRFGFSTSETNKVAWLVKHHLIMSDVAFKRDLMDPKTIQDFAVKVKTVDMLNMLVTLTVVDIRAVRPGVWNGWKGQLLRDLYTFSLRLLEKGKSTDISNAIIDKKAITDKKSIITEKLKTTLKQSDIQQYLNIFHNKYWLAEDEETLLKNADLVTAFIHDDKDYLAKVSSDNFQQMTHISICAHDKPGLFAMVAGALSLAGANILGAKIHTTQNGLALDNFTVQNYAHKPFDEKEQLDRLNIILKDTFEDKVNFRKRLQEKKEQDIRTQAFDFKPYIRLDNDASNSSTVIEINAKDRPGLVYDLAHQLFCLELNLISAHIATYGEHAADVFYLRDKTGNKITDKTRLSEIQQRMIEASSGKLLSQKSILGTR